MYADNEDEERGERGLVPFQPQSLIVRPIASATDMRAAIVEYEQLKSALLRPSDIQVIQGKPHVKKSGWLRIARAFGVTVHPVSEKYIADGTDWGYEIVVRAEAPNGASMPGDGACWASEKQVYDRDGNLNISATRKNQTRHNVRAHAYTRASNRAISNLVGGGEVSAEELQDYVDSEPVRTPPVQPMTTVKPAQPATAATATPVKGKPTREEWGKLWGRAYKIGLVTTEDEFNREVGLANGTTPERGAALIAGGASRKDYERALERFTQLAAAHQATAESASEPEPEPASEEVDPDAPIEHDLHDLTFAGVH